jgi:hypothetical protein
MYTSGRWLRRDKLECESRCITFNFNSLCQKVIALCLGAVSIAKYDKKEGGFNRVFIFTTDNAKRIVARLPFSIAAPPGLRTNSEIATNEYRMSNPSFRVGCITQLLTVLNNLVQQNTSVPIPKVLHWNDSASNSIGSEYIIMEHFTGVQLHQRWSTMTETQRIRCIEAIYQKAKELVDIKLPVYGSLYFGNYPFKNALYHLLKDGFSIGRHCGAIYWDCNVGESRYYHNVMLNQGPCKTSVMILVHVNSSVTKKSRVRPYGIC